MHIQKRLLFYKFSKYRFQLLNAFIIVFIFCVVLSRTSSRGDNETSSTFFPISNVETQKSIYTVTVDIYGNENYENIRMLSEVFNGLNINATFFVTTDWIEKNSELKKDINNDNNSFGLLILTDIDLNSRRETIEFMAKQNDLFFKAFQYYPSYVRINSEKKGKIPELIGAFGQKYISSSVSFNENTPCVNNGDIVSISEINTETPYSVAEYLYSLKESGFDSVCLDKLLEEDNKEESLIN